MRRGIRRVAVGVSGGVDSAVSALLLKKKGFDVVGVFMQNWDLNDETGKCMIEQDYEDIKHVCNRLGVPLIHVNFVKEYWNDVFSDMLKDYEMGFTPNPDIRCNKFIKFRSFHDYAIKVLGADAIATGHYAKTNFGPYLEHFMSNDNVRLLKARDRVKDQTFFLSQVPQDSLRRAMFPVGDYLKTDVIKIARENGLGHVAKKKESMGICFIGVRRFQQFISEYLENRPGNFVNLDTGAVVGRHNGIHHWTLGQRCRIGGAPKRYFVFRKDTRSNDILVVQGTNHPALYAEVVLTANAYWINPNWADIINRQQTLACDFRFQHTMPSVPCRIFKTVDDRLIIHLSEPVRALTQGQFAVLYLDDECLGGATILSVGPSSYSLDRAKVVTDCMNHLEGNMTKRYSVN